MGDALKPCPLCAGAVRRAVGDDDDSVPTFACTMCSAQFRVFSAEHMNRRAPSPLPSVEAIRHMIRVNIPSATDAHGVTDAARAVLALIGGEK